MKYFILLIMFCLTCHFSTAQVDQNKMDKDLEVIENVLGAFLNKNHRFTPKSEDIRARYLSNYGVVIGLPNNGFTLRALKLATEDDPEKGEKMKKKSGNFSFYGSDMMDSEERLKEFLADYGPVIRQLKSSDNIKIKTDARSKYDVSGHGGVIAWNSNEFGHQGISVEVSKSDLNLFEDDEITREELYDKMVVKDISDEYKDEPDLSIFASLLQRIWDVKLSESYYMNRVPKYERFENAGVTYYLKYYSSMVHDENDYSLPTLGKKNISADERNKIVEDLYPKFVDAFKESILDYGHVLKSIEPSETITFHISLTSCEGCDMPAVIEIEAKKSVIDDYRKEKIGLDQALSAFSVKDVE